MPQEHPASARDLRPHRGPATDPALDPQVDNEAYVRAVHDQGLAFDLATLSRRRMVTGLGLVGVAAFTGTSLLTGAGRAAAATAIESETAGPYPADGSNDNGLDVRTTSGIVRSDIRSSFGVSNAATAAGIPLTIRLTVTNLADAPLAGAAVYLWHCDRDGNYSLYSSGITDQNYLRGIQVAGATGTVTFTSIFPACYSGRWPHIHFEVYSSLTNATSGSGPIVKTSQMAIPEQTARAVYATTGYSTSVTNISQVTLATDNVFGDDSAAHEIPTVTGSVGAGYTVALTAAVDPTATESTWGTGAPGGGGTPGGPGGPGGTPPTGPPTGTPTPTGADAPALPRRSRRRR